jgi:hypothetical protein
MTTRREFLASASLAAAAGLAFPAPAVAQRPKLVYWCYQFLKSSDDARANFAQEWAKKNNVDLQLSMVPWKEFCPRSHGHRGLGHPRHRVGGRRTAWSRSALTSPTSTESWTRRMAGGGQCAR